MPSRLFPYHMHFKGNRLCLLLTPPTQDSGTPFMVRHGDDTILCNRSSHSRPLQDIQQHASYETGRKEYARDKGAVTLHLGCFFDDSTKDTIPLSTGCVGKTQRSWQASPAQPLS